MTETTNAFSVTDFCRSYGIGRSFAYAEMAAGRLAYRKAGRRTIILREDAEKWATELPEGGKRHAS